jgi:GTP-binding protein EngB required for normal cell division
MNIIFVGMSGVGKTPLIHQIIQKNISDPAIQTKSFQTYRFSNDTILIDTPGLGLSKFCRRRRAEILEYFGT